MLFLERYIRQENNFVIINYTAIHFIESLIKKK